MENRDQIHVADQVVAVIAGRAANDIPGVVSSTNGLYGDFAKRLSRKITPKGVDVTILDEEAIIQMRVRVHFGTRIDQVCRQIQTRVKEEVEWLVGLSVREVNIQVDGVVMQAADKSNEQPDEYIMG